MKRLLLLLSLFVSAATFGQSGELKFKLDKNGFALNGKKIPAGWSIETFTSIIGSDARSRDGHNRTHSYDRSGVVLFEPKKEDEYSGRVSELQIYFRNIDPNEVSPKNVFTGSFKIDKLSLSKDVDLATVRKELKGFEESESYLGNSVRLARGDYYFYFHFDEYDKLAKLSVGYKVQK